MPPAAAIPIPFARTSCGCDACTSCCQEQPGSLAPGDLERIAAHLGKPVQDILHRFWASPGALLMDRTTGEMYRQGTITPKRTNNGRCTFLTNEGLCAIHPVAPAGCALFDTHMSAAEAQPRSQWLAKAQSDPEYQSVRRCLPEARSWKPRGY